MHLDLLQDIQAQNWYVTLDLAGNSAGKLFCPVWRSSFEMAAVGTGAVEQCADGFAGVVTP